MIPVSPIDLDGLYNGSSEAVGDAIRNLERRIAFLEGAPVPWDQVLKAGSSLGDLQTTDAGDLTSGTLPYARISAHRIPRVVLTGGGVAQNNGTTATTVMTYTIPAGSLADGDFIRGICKGRWAGNANNKSVNLQFDGNNALILGGGTAINGGSWMIHFWLSKATNTSAQVNGYFISHNASGVIVSNSFNYTQTVDFAANAYVLRLQLTGQATGDILRDPSKFIWEPN